MVEGHLISAHFFFFSWSPEPPLFSLPGLSSICLPSAFLFYFFFGGEVESPEYFTPVCGVQVFMPRASRVHFFLWQSLVVFSCSVSARISNCLAPRVRHSYLACFSRLRVVAHS